MAAVPVIGIAAIVVFRYVSAPPTEARMYDHHDSAPIGGVAGDTFLHMVDAWVEGKLGVLPNAKIDAAVRKLDAFIDAMGDRFEDAADLERAIATWTLRVGPKKAAACVVLSDTLALWKAVEEMESSTQGS